ncbi:MAG: SMI1/KNR4 family protein [Cytophagaceae bacterium]|nr:MAG: SMI1/KNR4 family protein [Cytophagaceae bacterium]
MSNAFVRITQWLAAHAPRVLEASLNPGASAAELSRLATAVGRPLPADYQELYRWHNGLNEEADNWGSFFYGMHFLPLAEVLDAYQYQAGQTKTSPLEKADATVRPAVLQNPYWLRLGFDGGHGWLCVDLDPAAAGTYGQVIYLYEIQEIAFRVAGSVTELLTEFAHDLERGLYSLDADALEDGNEFLVPDEQFDPGNWEWAERWQAISALLLPPAA